MSLAQSSHEAAMKSERESYMLVLQALPDEPDGPSAARRLARGLKYLLRSCRLKCLSVLPAPTTPAAAESPDSQQKR